MAQDEMKRQVGAAAAALAIQVCPKNSILGVGTGSTANCFIDAIAPHKAHFRGAVASSKATAQRLLKHGFTVFELNDVSDLPLYVDGADEVDSRLCMIKGGGGALTREKIVAAVAQRFVCIVDASKCVAQLGKFPLAVEVIPMACQYVARQLQALGARPVLRDFITDNGNQILDTHDLRIDDPLALENTLNQITGVVCHGLFAHRGADVLLTATSDGVIDHFPSQSEIHHW